jgi:hypothetical protein
MELMNRVAKYFIKKQVKKTGEKVISKIEGITLHDGLYLNVFNSGVKVDLSKLIKKGREILVREAKKQLKRL